MPIGNSQYINIKNLRDLRELVTAGDSPQHILFRIMVRWQGRLDFFRNSVSLIIWNMGVGTVGKGREIGKEPHLSSRGPSLVLWLRGPSDEVISSSDGSETSRESFLQEQKYFHLYANNNGNVNVYNVG
jgi:hypothetical protein